MYRSSPNCNIFILSIILFRDCDFRENEFDIIHTRGTTGKYPADEGTKSLIR